MTDSSDLLRRLTLRQLRTFRTRDSGTRAVLEALLSGQAWVSGMEARSNETIKQAVMAGMGIAFISAHTVAPELQTQRLVVLDVLGTPVRRTLSILQLPSRRLSPLAEAFSDFVLEEGARCIDCALAVPEPA